MLSNLFFSFSLASRGCVWGFGILISPSTLHGYSVYRAILSILIIIENIAFGIIGQNISETCDCTLPPAQYKPDVNIIISMVSIYTEDIVFKLF